MQNSQSPINRDLNITNEICPMTFVRTRLALDQMESGQVLRVLLTGAEPLRNVPETAKQQGHEVLAITPLEGGMFSVDIRKG
jgi:TusA-related sulfurtransferase